MPYYGRQPSGQQLQQAAGGNPFYNPYSPYPNIGMGIASTFGNIMAMKEMRKQEDYDKEQEDKKLTLEERRIAAYEKSLEPRIKETPEWRVAIDAYKKQNPNATDWDAIKVIRNIQDSVEKETTVYPTEFNATQVTRYGRDDWQDVVAKDQQGVDYSEWMYKRRKDGTATSTDYDKAVEYIKGEIKAGRKTPEQGRVYMEKILGVYEDEEAGAGLDYSGGRGASSRGQNERSYLERRAGLSDKAYPQKLDNRAKAFGKHRRENGQLPMIDGIRLDMPDQYQLAVVNQRDGVASEHGISTIQRYDDMWEVFVELVTPGEDGLTEASTWAKFKEHELYNSNIDRVRMKFWYQAYASLR